MGSLKFGLWIDLATEGSLTKKKLKKRAEGRKKKSGYSLPWFPPYGVASGNVLPLKVIASFKFSAKGFFLPDFITTHIL